MMPLEFSIASAPPRHADEVQLKLRIFRLDKEKVEEL